MKYLLFNIVLFLSLSCSENFLDLAPISGRSVDGFYNDENELQQALIGVYDGLQSTQTPTFSMLLKEQRSDNSFQQSPSYSFHDILHFAETADNTQLYPAWSSLYKVIYRCNIFLSKVEGVTFETDVVKQQVIGEAKAVRALMYFDLVRYFGGVPIVTSTITIDESFELKRSSVDDVYQQIITDLQDASNSLPENYSGDDVGRIDKFAAKALLGRV